MIIKIKLRDRGYYLAYFTMEELFAISIKLFEHLIETL